MSAPETPYQAEHQKDESLCVSGHEPRGFARYEAFRNRHGAPITADG